MSNRSQALAERLEAGARALAEYTSSLSDSQWQARIPGDGRTVCIIVHHVASMYPLEMQLAQTLAEGKPMTGVTWDVVAEINAAHDRDNAGVSKEAALALLATNSAAAAKAIRALTDQELDRAATVSLYFDAPLTCQFWLEDHPVRHSYHHLGRIKGAVPQLSSSAEPARARATANAGR